MPVAAVHAELDRVLACARELVVAGDGARAHRVLTIYRALTAGHADDEEALLVPLLDGAARWPPALYHGQHGKLLAGLDRVAPLVPALCASTPGWRRRALVILDALGPVVHLAEHHHQAEETDLFAVARARAPDRLDEVAARFWAAHAGVAPDLAEAAAALGA
ncbi:MAG: hemerythrin domain-containing protein [Kofleriaceae bacterium]